MSLELKLRGQLVRLLGQKLIHLPTTRTLLVADTHFGKAATFRQAGIPVPVGTTAKMLRQLTNVIDHWEAKRLIVLGDFVHSTTRSKVDFEQELIQWRQQCPQLEIILVAGNHDRGNNKLFERLGVVVVREPYLEAPFAFCHFAEANENIDLFTFAGHVHPAIRLPGMGRSEGKIPCFAVNENVALLPAFGEFTGTTVVARSEFSRIFVTVDQEVIELEKLTRVRGSATD